MLDRSQIEQVLINLLKNAGEACVEQTYPEVIISTHYDLDKHLFFLSVCDNGSGILPEVLDKIFVPFSQRSRQVVVSDSVYANKL